MKTVNEINMTQLDKIIKLNQEIKILRQRLGAAIEDNNISSNEVLKISEELDNLIVDYYNSQLNM